MHPEMLIAAELCHLLLNVNDTTKHDIIMPICGKCSGQQDSVSSQSNPTNEWFRLN